MDLWMRGRQTAKVVVLWQFYFYSFSQAVEISIGIVNACTVPLLYTKFIFKAACREVLRKIK
jgi:hypothetical protein